MFAHLFNKCLFSVFVLVCLPGQLTKLLEACERISWEQVGTIQAPLDILKMVMQMPLNRTINFIEQREDVLACFILKFLDVLF